MECESFHPRSYVRSAPADTAHAGATARDMPRTSTDIPVDSSLIKRVTYAADATLTVHFHSGAVYRYFTVPRHTLEAFLTATSKGTYFNRYIRDGFPYQRIEES